MCLFLSKDLLYANVTTMKPFDLYCPAARPSALMALLRNVLNKQNKSLPRLIPWPRNQDILFFLIAVLISNTLCRYIFL